MPKLGENLLPPKVIFECANAHGGDFSSLKETVEVFSDISSPGKAIKFQPFKHDLIALPDFEWYPVYLDLFLSEDQWREMVDLSRQKSFDVWLDIFDLYSVKILENNIDRIAGIKLQSSVLYNHEILSALDGLKLSNTAVMINISGHDMKELPNIVESVSRVCSTKPIVQIGHQSYPTPPEDAGLQKIAEIHTILPDSKMCFADHSPAEELYAYLIPCAAVALGCEYVEKHICLDRELSKYDFQSALQPDEMRSFCDSVDKIHLSKSAPFITESEREYLEKSEQVPVASKLLVERSLVSTTDVLYRRTAQNGLRLSEIEAVQSAGFILNKDVAANTVLQPADFDKARVGTIVACRMKSSRLKSKALLPLGGVASVDRCLEQCLRFPGEEVVLATSTFDGDTPLETHDLGGKAKVFRGNPDDVLERLVACAEQSNLDIIIRVTADCPVVSWEIAEILLDAHFKSGADYTAARECAVGTGCEIYNLAALKRVYEMRDGDAELSEYLTWYMTNNRDIFKVHEVDLPAAMVRDYRLTLDYQEDADLFEGLYVELNNRGLPSDLESIFSVLDRTPDLAEKNTNRTLVYKTDEALIQRLNEKTRLNR